VIKLININKYKQTRDEVNCNIQTEIDIDVHNDVKKKQ